MVTNVLMVLNPSRVPNIVTKFAKQSLTRFPNSFFGGSQTRVRVKHRTRVRVFGGVNFGVRVNFGLGLGLGLLIFCWLWLH